MHHIRWLAPNALRVGADPQRRGRRIDCAMLDACAWATLALYASRGLVAVVDRIR
jgi:hypothetical protein